MGCQVCQQEAPSSVNQKEQDLHHYISRAGHCFANELTIYDQIIKF